MVPPGPAPVSKETAPNPSADIIPQLPKEWGAAGLETPPTPEPGGGGWVASLPAGLLPGQLVTFPVRQCRWDPGGLPGQVLAGEPAPEAAERSGRLL